MADELTIEPRQLADRLAKKEKIFLLDCRENWEHDIARLDGATLIPMQQIPAELSRIPRDQEVVVYCHHGQRSFTVTLWLRRQGLPALSLEGGIDRWSEDIDPNLPRY